MNMAGSQTLQIVEALERYKVCNILVRQPERKTPLGKPRCKWEDNIRMDVRDLG
jgi:hypothetical protein